MTIIPLLQNEEGKILPDDSRRGFDYGLGRTNINSKTGIRYGVIPLHQVLKAWADSSEPLYKYYCECGNFLTRGAEAKRCSRCKRKFDENYFDMFEPVLFQYKGDGYIASQTTDDPDIFILKSPYYTKCQYCSPCAPGAGYVISTVEPNGVKAYCFGHDWFELGMAPYPVYSIKGNKQIFPEKTVFPNKEVPKL